MGVKSVFKTTVLGPYFACKSMYHQTDLTQCILWHFSMCMAYSSSNNVWIINYMLENFDFSTAEANIAIAVFFIVFAAVTALTAAFLKPGLLPCLGGAISFVVAVI